MTTRRPAFSLVEMLVSITLVSVALAWIAIVLQALFQVERSSRDALAFSASIARLDQQFREDVHQAAGARVNPEAPSTELILEMGDGSLVRYRTLEGRIERIAGPADSVDHRDSFRLRRGVRAKFDVPDADHPPTAALDWHPSDRGQAMRVEAVVGLSRRSVAGRQEMKP